MTAPKLPEGLEPELRLLAASMRHSAGQWMVPGWDGHKVAVLLEKAQAALQALAADTARLDWLDKNPGRIKHSIGYRDSRDSWVYTDANGYGHDAESLRAAIDSAIALVAKEAK
jgi:hypothetical protein